jgi:hypothetical protein
MLVRKLIQLKSMPNRLEMIVLMLEQVQKQLLLIFVSQVSQTFYSIINLICFFLLFLLGEDKPQPYIVLDIDRQVDGKLVTSNHITVSPPNGRLPMSSNYPPNNSLPLLTHTSQPHPNAIPLSAPHSLDGGVYQGQQPPQSSNWIPNTKVNLFV